MLDWFRNIWEDLPEWAPIAGLGLVILVLLIWVLGRDTGNVDEVVLTATINAASTQNSVRAPTLSANLSLTPELAVLTGAAPTLELIGRTEVQQFAASAIATSQLGDVDYSAVQAAGPPNTETCGDSPSAWASLFPTEQAALTLFFVEVVRPSGLLIFQSNNPNFVTRVVVTDLFGEQHIVYDGEPILQGVCPFTLLVEIPDGDLYGTTSVTLFLDQTGAPGWNQIDAVELIGTKY